MRTCSDRYLHRLEYIKKSFQRNLITPFTAEREDFTKLFSADDHVPTMPPSRPFFSPPSGEIDADQVIEEARPLAKLIGTVGVVALIPIAVQIFLVEFIAVVPLAGVIFTLAAQFIAAVGTGIVLIYIIVRANQLTTS